MLDQNERNLRTIDYILALFTNFIGVLIFYLLVNTDQYSQELKDDAKQLLNNYISFAIYYVVSFILVFVIIGIFAFFVFGILQTVFTIVGLIKAINNEHYDLPLTIQFIK